MSGFDPPWWAEGGSGAASHACWASSLGSGPDLAGGPT